MIYYYNIGLISLLIIDYQLIWSLPIQLQVANYGFMIINSFIPYDYLIQISQYIQHICYIYTPHNFHNQLYYKKCISQSCYSIESQYDKQLMDYVLLAIVNQRIQNIQQMMDYFTWTLYYYGLLANPGYYNVRYDLWPDLLEQEEFVYKKGGFAKEEELRGQQSTGQSTGGLKEQSGPTYTAFRLQTQEISIILSDLVEQIIHNLVTYDLIEYNEETYEIEALNNAIICCHYSLSYKTMKLFKSVTNDIKLSSLFHLLSSADELSKFKVDFIQPAYWFKKKSYHLPLQINPQKS